jgi:hypothetical protein
LPERVRHRLLWPSVRVAHPHLSYKAIEMSSQSLQF